MLAPSQANILSLHEDREKMQTYWTTGKKKNCLLIFFPPHFPLHCPHKRWYTWLLQYITKPWSNLLSAEVTNEATCTVSVWWYCRLKPSTALLSYIIFTVYTFDSVKKLLGTFWSEIIVKTKKQEEAHFDELCFQYDSSLIKRIGAGMWWKVSVL